MMAGVGSRIGVSFQDFERVDQGDGLTEGAAVTALTNQDPARAAGIETGDVIVKFDGERVRSARQFSRLVSDTPAGRTVPAEIIRGRRRVPLEVTPESGTAWIGRPARRLGRDLSKAIPDDFDLDLDFTLAPPGVDVIDLTPQLAGYFGVEAGVLVTTVIPSRTHGTCDATLRRSSLAMCSASESCATVRSCCSKSSSTRSRRRAEGSSYCCARPASRSML